MYLFYEMQQSWQAQRMMWKALTSAEEVIWPRHLIKERSILLLINHGKILPPQFHAASALLRRWVTKHGKKLSARRFITIFTSRTWPKPWHRLTKLTSMTNPTYFKSMLLFMLSSMSSDTFRFCVKYYCIYFRPSAPHVPPISTSSP